MKLLFTVLRSILKLAFYVAIVLFMVLVVLLLI